MVQSIVEVRFTLQPFSEEVLPGLIFSKIRDRFPISEKVFLPPIEIRQMQPQLAYLVAASFTGEHGKVAVGERVFQFIAPDVYPGWHRLSESIRSVLSDIKALNIYQKVERYSIKYVNILSGADSIKGVDFSWNLGSLKPPVRQVGLRVENHDHGFIDIVSLASEAVANVSGKMLTGTLLDVDVIKTLDSPLAFDSFDPAAFDECHDRAKSLFFDALKPETVDAFGPEN